MSKQYSDFLKFKNKWMYGKTLNITIDDYSDVVQFSLAPDNTIVFSIDELEEYLKICEKALDVLKRRN